MSKLPSLTGALSLVAAAALFTGCLPPGFQKGEVEGKTRINPAVVQVGGFGVTADTVSFQGPVKVEIEAKVKSLITDFNDLGPDSTQFNASGELEIEDLTTGLELNGKVFWGGIYQDFLNSPNVVNVLGTQAAAQIQPIVNAIRNQSPPNSQKTAQTALLYGFLTDGEEGEHKHHAPALLNDVFLALVIEVPVDTEVAPFGLLPKNSTLVLTIVEGEDGIYLAYGLAGKGKIHIEVKKDKK